MTWRPAAVVSSILVLLLGGLGWLLLTDRPGLRAEYFALTPDWQGPPAYVGVGEPQKSGPQGIRSLVSQRIFSVRWRGRLVVETGGKYKFRVRADEGGYLVLDGERAGRRMHRVALEPGVHTIEVGFRQTSGKSRVQTSWKRRGGEFELLPAELLHARGPVRVRHLLRSALRSVARPWRQLLGALALLTGLLLLRFVLSGSDLRPAWVAGGSQDWSTRERRTLLAGLLVGLLVLTWWWTTRFTAPLLGGDDVRYVYKALFPAKAQWFYNRYVHVYLLKAFIWLRDGDAFLGSRTYWSFMFSVTVGALAVGCRCLGPRLQLRTVAVTLFVLLSQTSLIGRAGAAYTDYTNMMFITLAVVVYLHALRSEQHRGRSRWHELAIGALTVAACKSKETGIILAWMPLLFLWSEGRVDLRGFVRKMGYWASGAAAALLVLMSLDAWLLGDFWYSVKPDFAGMKRIHVTHEPTLLRSISRWIKRVWSPYAPPPLQALRYAWLLALAAPIVAVVRRKRIELAVLFLIPLGYLVLMFAVHTWAPHVFSTRILLPVLPVCCLAVGSMLYWLGLEERPLRQLLQPRVLVPLVSSAAVLMLLVNPVRSGDLEPTWAAGIGPAWLGWLLVLAASAPLLKARARAALMVLLVLFLFGPSFKRAQQSLAERHVAQRGELILYPWEAFREELEEARPRNLLVDSELWRTHRMLGQSSTRQTIARIFFRQRELYMRNVARPDADRAVLGLAAFSAWRQEAPGLDAVTVFDRSGNIALVRPRELPQPSVE